MKNERERVGKGKGVDYIEMESGQDEKNVV